MVLKGYGVRGEIKILIEPSGDNKMAAQDTNFFYYRLYAKDSQRQVISLPSTINIQELEGNKITLKGENNKHYDFSFRQIESGFFYGQIIRSKDNKEYATMCNDETDWSPLHSKVGEGKTSETELDRVNFVLGAHGNDFVLLIQRGFQYAGANKLTEFFNTFFNAQEYSVGYKQLETEKVKALLKNLLSQNKVEKIVLKTKSDDADLPAEKAVHFGLIKSLRKLEFDGFDIVIEIRLNKAKKGSVNVVTKAEDILRKWFKLQDNSEEIVDSLASLDLQDFFSRIDVITEGRQGQTRNKNILDKFEQETISFNKSSISMTDTLIEKLIAAVKDKISILNREQQGVR